VYHAKVELYGGLYYLKSLKESLRTYENALEVFNPPDYTVISRCLVGKIKLIKEKIVWNIG
jgi:hypothetical protein